MHYEDEARPFNFLSGLVLGVLLGTGLALLGVPRRRSRKPRHLRNSARSLQRRTLQGTDRIRDQWVTPTVQSLTSFAETALGGSR
jgi:hypothetical protein